MNENLLKALPFVVGGVLGYVLVASPEWLADLGPLRYLVSFVLVLVALLAFVAWTVLQNLPENLALDPAGEALPPEVATLVQRFAALGFVPVGPPLRVGMAPPALLAGLVQPDGRAYATVFRTGTVPARVSFDCVSIMADGRGGLTSSPLAAGAALPGDAGNLRQVIVGATPEALVAAHQAAQRWTETRGIVWKRLSAQDFPHDFRAAIARQRRFFLTGPLQHTAVTLFRVATRTTPHLGPLDRQACAAHQIAALTGRR